MEQMSSSEYEGHVAAVLDDKFRGKGVVERDVRLRSRSGVRDRQIDVLVRMALPGMDDSVIVVDTKRYSEAVDAKDVEAFIGLVSDVGAEMGLLVTNRGLLHREFVAFFRGAIDRETLAHPARAGVTVA
ncbi:MAG: hypothetical protein QOE91_106 [Gaiellaceae bacterium]|nr:hypothetical protein [Gaiellaceae bacterium]